MKPEDVKLVQIRDYFDMTNKEFKEEWKQFSDEDKLATRIEVVKTLEKKDE